MGKESAMLGAWLPGDKCDYSFVVPVTIIHVMTMLDLNAEDISFIIDVGYKGKLSMQRRCSFPS